MIESESWWTSTGISCNCFLTDQAEKLQEELKSQKLELTKDRDTLQQELANLRIEVCKKDALLVDMQKEVGRLCLS